VWGVVFGCESRLQSRKRGEGIVVSVKDNLFGGVHWYSIDCVRYARRVGRPQRDAETGLGLGIVTTPR